MFREALLSSVALTTLTTAAFAAPLPNIAPWNWTGFYVGANAGAIWSKDGVYDTDLGFFGSTIIPGYANVLEPGGVLGGVQAGFNWQISSIVLGIEAEFEATDLDNRFNYAGFFGGTATHSVRLSSFGDIRGRIGAAFGQWLPYATAGVVFADLHHSLVDPSIPFSLSRSSPATGWIAGVGLEYALNSHWSLKVEYLYMQFPDVSRIASGLLIFFPYSFKDKLTLTDSAQIARIGINYRF
jgi:outer membrane immunogenic protein